MPSIDNEEQPLFGGEAHMVLCTYRCYCFQVGRDPEPSNWVQIQNQISRYLKPENNIHIGRVMFKLASRTPLKGTRTVFRDKEGRDSLEFCFASSVEVLNGCYV